MDELKSLPERSVKYIKYFFKWLAIGLLLGAAGGLVGTLFHKLVELVIGVREVRPWLVWLLPLGGLATAGMYAAARVPLDTNRVIKAVHRKEDVPIIMAPLIFVSTVITHLFGGSAGREGAALQIGGAIGWNLGRLIRLDERDMHLAVACGMASVFSALFGVPVAAAVFSLEVASVGIFYYAGLVPCLTASLTAGAIASALGVKGVSLGLPELPAMTLASVGAVLLVAVCCAVLSIVFCLALHHTEAAAKAHIKYPWLRPMVGGAAVAVLTWLVGTYDYNSLGLDVVQRAIGGSAEPEAFALKMLFTVLTVSFGFKGGEIVPTMFIGSTFGCLVGTLIGFQPGFCAAVGLISLLCGVLNCPFAMLVMSVELFGSEALPLFAAAVAVSYTLSGTYGLYGEQNLVYSKLRAMYINIHTK
ncbi:MAG: chloride channel protein [Oscillospiraceae bacterium]|nr:chloride channel protein [Oscillospiraceae bacterium]